MKTSLCRQLGLTLVEAAATVAVLAATLLLVNSLVTSYLNDVNASVTAQQIRAVGDAAKRYIQDHTAGLVAAATHSTPAVVTVAQLVTAGYLPAGTSGVNNRRQTMCVLVLEPVTNRLEGLVITEGGDTLDDLTLARVSNAIGAAGGRITSSSPTTLTGTQGAWSRPLGGFGTRNCAGNTISGGPGAGHNVMALWLP